MAGIYIHIPFCRQACIYCDFHFSTLERDRAAMPAAILREAQMRKEYLGGQELQSIYFGGGTPSLLPPDILQEMLDGLGEYFHWNEDAEITIEANPDDLNEDYFKALRDTQINRLSIGIQSFKEADLKMMGRAHNAEEARRCLELADQYGFDNLSLDLIYGLPNQTEADWQWQLDQLAAYAPGHFSAYALTVEEKTVLAHKVKQRELLVDEAAAAQHFRLLQAFAAERGYEHYELSNFARAGQKAQHNSSYWYGAKYLGLGPAAHSYNGGERNWNVANNALYLKSLESGDLAMETETLSENDRFNEWLMTSLRLEAGLATADLARFSDALQSHFQRELAPLLRYGKLQQNGGRVFIPTEMRFFSDGIAADLFHLSE